MIAFLVAVGAAESGRPTLMFLTKEAVRLAVEGVAVGVACEGCPPLSSLFGRYTAAGGRYYVCPICFDAKVPAVQPRRMGHRQPAAHDLAAGDIGDDPAAVTMFAPRVERTRGADAGDVRRPPPGDGDPR